MKFLLQYNIDYNEADFYFRPNKLYHEWTEDLPSDIDANRRVIEKARKVLNKLESEGNTEVIASTAWKPLPE